MVMCEARTTGGDRLSDILDNARVLRYLTAPYVGLTPHIANNASTLIMPRGQCSVSMGSFSSMNEKTRLCHSGMIPLWGFAIGIIVIIMMVLRQGAWEA